MSYSQGLSGLNAASSQLSTIGNNVANANTVGFKGSTAQFNDAFAAALNGGGSNTQIGIGVQLGAVAQQFSQGNITATNSSLDLAINGGGFFLLSNAQGTTYSRTGQFQLNNSGNIVNSAGDKLLGYQITNGVASGSPTPLTVPTSVANAQATGSAAGSLGIVAGFNLNSSSLPPTTAFSPADPTTFNYSTPTTTFDSKGVAQNTTMYFVKSQVIDPVTLTTPTINIAGAQGNIVTTLGVTTVTLPNAIANPPLAVGSVIQGANFPAGTTVASLAGAGPTYTQFTTSANPTTAPVGATNYPLTIDVPNSWKVYTTVTDPTTQATIFPSPTPAAGAYTSNGTLTFSSGGLLPVFTPNALAPVVPPPGYGPSSATTAISFTPTGANLETIPFTFTAASQFGTANGINSITQDGYTAGQLSGFSVGTDGTITGKYSNGQSKALGQVALATFPSDSGLQQVGGNAWTQTSASGSPVVGKPGTGNNGILQTSATENSNVDLTNELVNMMTAQRFYQANAQTIKTQDSVMQTLINMR